MLERFLLKYSCFPSKIGIFRNIRNIESNNYSQTGILRVIIVRKQEYLGIFLGFESNFERNPVDLRVIFGRLGRLLRVILAILRVILSLTGIFLGVESRKLEYSGIFRNIESNNYSHTGILRVIIARKQEYLGIFRNFESNNCPQTGILRVILWILRVICGLTNPAGGCVADSWKNLQKFVWLEARAEQEESRAERCVAASLGFLCVAEARSSKLQARSSTRSSCFEARGSRLQARARGSKLEARSSKLEGRSSKLEGRSSKLEARGSNLDSRLSTLKARSSSLEARSWELPLGTRNGFRFVEQGRAELSRAAASAQRGRDLGFEV